ncbi:MAG: gliding motility protein GldL [Paludibacteraceae bacterium]|nr:gliding motility protein GldL [Paludibacteraceae bacterium]
MANAKKQSGFMLWYGSYKGKKIVNMIYCLGASVVIVGALFKILHWPGASTVLMLGMFTEAFLFAIGCLDDPHAEYHWGNVFPQLLEYGADPERLEEAAKKGAANVGGGMGGNGVAAQSNAAAPTLSDADMESLKGGIADLAKMAGQLGELGKVATASAKLAENMEAASTSATQFNNAASALGQKSEELSAAYANVVVGMQNVVNGTQANQQQVVEMNTKLASLNSIYELQINAVQAQVEAYKAQTANVNAMSADMQKVQVATAEAAKSSEAYQAAAQQLAQQVADLNKVYGNMLNALA